MKYDALKAHLVASGGQPLVLSLEQIEGILGFPLPPSSKDHPHQWWANTKTHSYADAWLEAGYLARPLLTRGQIEFTRSARARRGAGLQSISPPQTIWWVNQNKTYELERAGGYLFASKTDKVGASHYNWTNLSRVHPGDVILHYAKSRIQAISVAKSAAQDSERPPEQPQEEWGKMGWKVETKYFDLSDPIRRAEAWLPGSAGEKGPIDDFGGVKQGYLYELEPSWAAEFRQMYSDHWPALSPWGSPVAWVIRAWRPEDFDEAVSGEFVALNPLYFDKVGDMTGLDEVGIREAVNAAFPSDKASTQDERAKDLISLVSEMASGHLLIFTLNQSGSRLETTKLGQITGEYQFSPPRLAHRRGVTYSGDGGELPESLKRKLRAPVSMFKITDPEQIAAIFGNAQNGEVMQSDIASLVQRFKRESGYPTENDNKNLAGRAAMASGLTAEALSEPDADSLRPLANQTYGFAGPMARFYASLAADDGPERIAGVLRYLLYGEGRVAERLDNALDGDIAIPGLKIGLLTKALAVVYPAEWLTVYSAGDKLGRLAMLKRLGLEIPPKVTPGQTAVSSNDLLRDALAPFFGDDLWEASRFLYWLLAKDEVPTGRTLANVEAELYLDPGSLQRVHRLLADKRQVIFYGPPGTGKTYVAREFAKFLAPGRVTTVQFHPSYAYEDFVEGFRPRVEEGQAGFRLVDGPLKRAATAASLAPDQTHILLIDEINRGNIAKVFGELYYLLEYRDEEINLQYSESSFELPENLWIIGTMNTADRSIALVDAALRRRFHFLPFFPDEPPILGLLGRWLTAEVPDMLWVADIVEKANSRLEDRHRAIGPSHFLRKDLNEEWMQLIWEYSVLPYIAEQYFGEEERVADFRLDRLRRTSDPETTVIEGQDDDEGA